MGTVYKRGNIQWIKYYQNGKPIYESAKTARETEARRILQIREGQIAEGRFPGLRVERIRFDELVEDFLNDYRINGRKSLWHAEIKAKVLKEFFGGERASQISSSRIEAFIRFRQGAGLANATVNRELAALKRMFSLAAQKSPPKILRVPHIPRLVENNVRTGFFEWDDFAALRGALPDPIKVVVSIAYHTGFRRGEILELRWDQVDVPGRRIVLDPGTTKNNEGRIVYMTDDLHRVLEAWKRYRDTVVPNCPRVCFRMAKKKWAPIGDFRKSWESGCKRVGLEGRLLHDLRRTAVRNMVRAGVPERVAMRISGHKTRAIFDRYNIVSEEDLRGAAERLDQAGPGRYYASLHGESSRVNTFEADGRQDSVR